MKMKLVFPDIGTERGEEVVVEVDIIPRKGELLSWSESLNYTVTDVIHNFNGDSGDDHQVSVLLR